MTISLYYAQKYIIIYWIIIHIQLIWVTLINYTKYFEIIWQNHTWPTVFTFRLSKYLRRQNLNYWLKCNNYTVVSIHNTFYRIKLSNSYICRIYICLYMTIFDICHTIAPHITEYRNYVNMYTLYKCDIMNYQPKFITLPPS